jgi:outer membrane protein assembly factor BamD (BamD/ComL family)
MEFADRNVEQENYSAAIDMYDDILSAGIKNSNFQKRVLSAKVFALMRSGKPDEANRVSKSIESL